MSKPTLGQLFNKQWKNIANPYGLISMGPCLIVCIICGILLSPSKTAESLVIYISSWCMIGIAIVIAWTVLVAFFLAVYEKSLGYLMRRSMRR